MNRYGFVLCLLLVVVSLGGCSTKKNNFFSRTYHNVSAHYNTWWNGNEAIKEGISELELSAKDNFIDILPVYKLGTKSEAASVNSKADRAIEKAGIAIQRHSMFIRKKEHCRWIDDSYLMIGKAYFYKQDYYAAARTFDFTSSRYKGTAEATEALVWLIRTNTLLKRFTKAQNTIDEFKEMVRRGAVSKRVTKDYNLAVADFYCQQGMYNEAIPFLDEALWSTNLRAEKCRIAFIMGQIYQKDKNFAKATEYFRLAGKKGINYEYFINSKLNIAKCYTPATDNSNRINRYLTKMVKEDKNVEYRDQIYFALSEIARLDKKYPEMADYLQKSVAASKTNNYQRYESSILLADYLFLTSDYIKSKSYYDTASQFLPQEYPNYKDISKRINMFINLGSQFVIVKDEDSLQRVAKMPEVERNKLIDGIIEKIRKEQEEAKAQEERDKRLAEMGGLPTAPTDNNRPGGPGMPGMGKTLWYFYNTTLVTAGINDFNRRWGNRKLEDLWRLKNKQAIDANSDETEESLSEAEKAAADSIQKNTDNPLSREMYLANLPLKPEQIVVSNERIRDAYYAAANIFVDDLKDFKNGEKTFETLCERFPDTAMNKYVVYSYYQIYKINKDKLKNKSKADTYMNYIIEQFPETDYARLLLDPEYYIMLEARKNTVANLYKSAYDAYKSKNYFTVFGNTMIAETDYPDDPLIPKFKYLQALSMLKTDPIDSTAKVLQQIVTKYPTSEIKTDAENLLKSLVKLNPDHFKDYEIIDEGTTNDSVVLAKAKYIKEKKGTDKFNYVLMVDGSAVDIDALKMRVSDHNETYRKFNRLSITVVLAYDNHYMLIVGNFDDDVIAMDYFKVISEDDYIFSSQLKSSDPQTFIISKKHFQEMYKNKDYEDYYKFFYKEYVE